MEVLNMRNVISKGWMTTMHLTLIPGGKSEAQTEAPVPVPRIPSLSDPFANPEEAKRGLEELHIFLNQLPAISLLDGLRAGPRVPLKSVFLMRWSQEIRALLDDWRAQLNEVERLIDAPMPPPASGKGER